MMRSLRMRLLTSTSLTSLVVLSLLGISVYATMRHIMMRDFDASLHADARLLASMIQQKRDGRLDFEFDTQQLPEFLSDKRARFFEIWHDDGKVLARSPSLREHELQKAATATGFVTDVELPGDRDGHAVQSVFAVRREDEDERRPQPPARSVTIMVAAEPIEAHYTLRLLGWLLVTLCVAGVIVMGGVLLKVVGQGVRPVKVLAGKIESLRETDLSHRFSGHEVPEELAPVVDKLNGLLGRLEGVFTREKAFTADVAHELRTPLTGLRMTLEVCRSQPRETLAYETAMDECRAITDRMGAMVETLLMLARSDAGQMMVDREMVDVAQMISESWELFEHRAALARASVTFDLVKGCTVESDPDKLRIVLHNLIDNAVSYVDPGGRIRIAVRRGNDGLLVEIANTGSQVGAEDMPKLFERFWRGDIARSDAGAHCGLGLSLSQRLITLLGGKIGTESTNGGEFVARFRLPERLPPTLSGVTF